jgi:RNA-binding protein PNO1
MVVTHISAITPEGVTPPAKTKKNRRKITRKNATNVFPSDPSSSHLHAEGDDEEMSFAQDAGVSVHSGSTAPQKDDDEDELMIDTDPTTLATSSAAPAFPPVAPGAEKTTLKSETRRIPVPPHRMTPLKKDWLNIFGPLTEILGLQVRMNVQRRAVEIRTSKHTKDIGALQKGADFIKAYALGFDVNDAIALLRLDDLYLDSFEIKDVKTLHGDHLSRAIGRIAGQDGKTKFTIENTSRTRIVLADTKIHIMGSFQNIKIARDALVSLILGSPPGKVYAGLRTVSSRMKQRAL